MRIVFVVGVLPRIVLSAEETVLVTSLHMKVYLPFTIKVLATEFAAGMPFESFGTVYVINKRLSPVNVAPKFLSCVEFLLPKKTLPPFQAKFAEKLLVLFFQMGFELVLVLEGLVLVADQAHWFGYSLRCFEVFMVGKVHVCLFVFPHATFLDMLVQFFPLDEVLPCQTFVPVIHHERCLALLLTDTALLVA